MSLFSVFLLQLTYTHPEDKPMTEQEPNTQTPLPDNPNDHPEEKSFSGPAITAVAPEERLEIPARPESRFQSFLRQAVRWLIVFIVIFLLGALAFYWFGYRPLRQQYDQATVNSQQDQQKNGDLQAQITGLQAKVNSLSSLETKNQDLTKQLSQSNAHIALLRARSDVDEARLALAMNNPAGAKPALNATGQDLTHLNSLLPPDQQAAIGDMQSRLKLALGELDGKQYAAQSDLDVLAKSLADLETQLYP
jgi:cytoskeletal protein RodZ